MDRKIDKKQIRKEARLRYAKIGIAVACTAAAILSLSLLSGKSVYERDLSFGIADIGPLETTVAATGRVVPAFEEIINSPVDTRIVAVYAQPGDSVKAGTPLLLLDLKTAEADYSKLLGERRIKQNEITQLQLANSTRQSELAMQIKVKEMDVNRLAIEVDNERRLDSLGSGTGERVRQTETAYSTGVLELEQLRASLANERLRCRASEDIQRQALANFDQDLAIMKQKLDEGRIPAPHSGILSFISNEIGSRVAAGQKVAVVSDLSHFKIEGEVPESSSNRTGIGADVIVRIGSAELKGRVTNISPQSKAGIIPISIALDDASNPRLRSGLRTELYISYGYKDKALRIPAGPFFKGPGVYDLFVADGDGGMLRKRKVRLGDSNRNYIEVLNGLAQGDRVVVSDMEEFQKSNKLKLKK